MPVILLDKVNKYYNYGRSSQVHALRDISVAIESGTTTAIMGISGSGKSTLLHSIGLLTSIDKGKYELNGQDVSRYSKKEIVTLRNQMIGIVLQDYGLVDEATALHNCMAPAIFAGLSYRQSTRVAHAVLDKVSMNHLCQRNVSEMSGGERQRVAIARAIVNDPQVIIADEPTGALDTATSNEIIRILLDLQTSDSVLIIATHNHALAENCGQVLVLSDGLISLCEEGGG